VNIEYRLTNNDLRSLYKTGNKIIAVKKENNELISIRQLAEVLKLHRKIKKHK